MHSSTFSVVPTALEQPLVKRALEELKMLTQTDLERERYESRRKAQLDHNTIMNAARREGLREGREEGIKEGREDGLIRGERVGIIHFCERLRNRAQTPTEELASRPLEDLTRLAEELQAQVLK